MDFSAVLSMLNPAVVFYTALAAVVVALLVWITAGTRSRRQDSDPRYTKQECLFSAAERSFLGVLEQAVGGHFRIFGKVRVADVLEPPMGAGRRAALNRILAKHFDFVLCSQDSLTIVAVIELDDSSHNRRDRIDRDRFLSGACHAAGLPLIRVPARASYSVTELRTKLLAHLNAPGAN